MYFYCTYTYLGTGYFLKIAKINSQQEKPICPNRKNEFRQNTKNRQSAKINSRKNLVPHSRYVALARLWYFAIVMQITLSPLQRLPFPSCPACFLFSPSPQPPYDRRSLCRGESGKRLNVVTNTTVLFRCHFILIKLLAHSLPVFLIITFLVIFNRNVSYTEILFWQYT